MKIKFGKYKIRSFHPTDEEALIKYANNHNISKNLRDSFSNPYTEKDAELWLTVALNQNPELNFAIANEVELIGGIGLMPQQDVYHFSAEIGYWLAETFWGKDIMTAALKAMTMYTFENFEFKRLYANVFEFNPASEKVLKKAGYKLEGRMRKAVYKNGKFLDQMIYSILKDEVN